MSESKHTPGDYSAEKCPTDDITIAPSDHGTLWLVRFVDTANKVRGEIAICQGENAEANAKLFAEAPEMYEFLEYIVDAHGEMLATEYHMGGTIADAKALLARIRGENK